MKKRNLLLVALSVFSLLYFSGTGEAGDLPSEARDSDFYDNGAPDPAKVELGKFLFYDKVLSGNRNISCATCHHALTDTGDGLSLPVGEGGLGMGVCRDTGSGDDAIHERVPRNAPPVFNLGASEFQVMFHDGRVEPDGAFPSGFVSPADQDLPGILDNALAVQAMFPVTSPTEMRGQGTENNLSSLSTLPEIWNGLAARLQAIPEYVKLFKAAFSDIKKKHQITYAHAANAIAAFEAAAWRADDSPFDRYLRGDTGAMSTSAINGMELFYGEARCFKCHQGTFLTDHDFHAVAMPQIGPGRGDGYKDHEDYGREQVTGQEENRYQFRTLTLRNVALTGPWGHAGAFNSLEAVVRHFLNPVDSLYNYETSQAVLPSRKDLDAIDFLVMKHRPTVMEIADRLDPLLEPVPAPFTNGQVADLIEFLHALTDPGSIDLRHDVPERVPSGLPLAD